MTRAMSANDELGGRAVASMAGTTRNMINAISFPRFVKELITGVFKAMVETNQEQLQQYVELVRGVSQSLDGFAALGGGNDDMAKRWLADQFPQSFAIEAPEADDQPRPGDEPDPDDEPESVRLITRGPPPSRDALRAALSLEPGEQVPTSGGPELISFVRRSLARNRQQMLATMVQMGMQRIVVDSGRISAGMRFHIDASSAAAEQRHSASTLAPRSAPAARSAWAWCSASASVNSTIGYVQTNDVQTREEVHASADLTSSVELHFRTDQVAARPHRLGADRTAAPAQHAEPRARASDRRGNRSSANQHKPGAGNGASCPAGKSARASPARHTASARQTASVHPAARPRQTASVHHAGRPRQTPSVHPLPAPAKPPASTTPPAPAKPPASTTPPAPVKPPAPTESPTPTTPPVSAKPPAPAAPPLDPAISAAPAGLPAPGGAGGAGAVNPGGTRLEAPTP